MRLFRTTLVFLYMMGRGPVTSLSMMSSKKPSVAIIGGGISALSCAGALQSQFRPTIFDTGRLRPGGRCSSRMPGDWPKDGKETFPLLSKSLYDHAAQIITVKPNDASGFAEQVQKWTEEGIVKKYPPESVCELVSDGSKLSVVPLDTSNMYHGVNGMGCIPQAMAKEGRFPIEQDVWISPSNGVKYLKAKQKWKVKGYDETFDYLVIAHNGKCADRLMSKTPAKALHSLLRVNFNPTVPKNGGKRMTLNSIYSLTVCLKTPSALSTALPLPFQCGFVSNDKDLRLVSCQSRKYPRDNGLEVWTFLSSPKFAKKYKAPQENLPEELVDNVTDLLLEAAEKLLGIQDSSVRNSVVERRLQLWGAAVPLNIYQGGRDGFLWDSDFHVGVSGDWLVEPSIAGAWESGQRLAAHMMKDRTRSVGIPTAEEPAVFEISPSVSKVGIGSIENTRVVSSATSQS